MGFFRNLTDRVYNHRNDKSATPVDPSANIFVNPPAPQPSTHIKTGQNREPPVKPLYQYPYRFDDRDNINNTASTFQYESSSSALIPSNQMIMDELFSLRGYISNRMDALDAQNQQVQIEHQRLSYKINMMDLCKDPIFTLENFSFILIL
ncbi:hypothetical protein Lal_00034006 [Lupinus albus]|nr:hypothetical protein Lal_00034006 [Lupinus albus]